MPVSVLKRRYAQVESLHLERGHAGILLAELIDEVLVLIGERVVHTAWQTLR